MGVMLVATSGAAMGTKWVTQHRRSSAQARGAVSVPEGGATGGIVGGGRFSLPCPKLWGYSGFLKSTKEYSSIDHFW